MTKILNKYNVAAPEMWCYYRLLRVSWKVYVRNKAVLTRIDEERKVLFVRHQKQKAEIRSAQNSREWHLPPSTTQKDTEKIDKRKQTIRTGNNQLSANSSCKIHREIIECAKSYLHACYLLTRRRDNDDDTQYTQDFC